MKKKQMKDNGKKRREKYCSGSVAAQVNNNDAPSMIDEFAAFNTVDINADILAGSIKDVRLSSDERGVRETGKKSQLQMVPDISVTKEDF